VLRYWVLQVMAFLCFEKWRVSEYHSTAAHTLHSRLKLLTELLSLRGWLFTSSAMGMHDYDAPGVGSKYVNFRYCPLFFFHFSLFIFVVGSISNFCKKFHGSTCDFLPKVILHWHGIDGKGYWR